MAPGHHIATQVQQRGDISSQRCIRS